MTPIKIWGVIIIVCGIILIDRGISSIFLASIVQTELDVMNQELIKLLGQNYAMGLNQSNNMAGWTNFISVTGIFIGIGMAIGGTFMIQDVKQAAPQPFAQQSSEYKHEANKEWRM